MHTARFAAAITALLVAVGPARATTLYTPPLSSPTPGVCTLVNLGSKPLDVTIDVVNGGGVVTVSETSSAPPAGVVSISPNATFASTIGYCRFTFRASKNKVRAGYFQVGPGPSFLLQTVVRAE